MNQHNKIFSGNKKLLRGLMATVLLITVAASLYALTQFFAGQSLKTASIDPDPGNDVWVSGRVYKELASGEQQPLFQATIQTCYPNATSTKQTDAQGNFGFWIPSGQGHCIRTTYTDGNFIGPIAVNSRIACSSGNCPPTYEWQMADRDCSVEAGCNSSQQAEDLNSDTDFDLKYTPRPMPVSGRVVQQNGQPLPSTVNITTCYPNPTDNVNTNSDGTFSFMVPYGTGYCVHVTTPPAGYAGPVLNDYRGPGPGYEWQVAGTDCTSIIASCTPDQVNLDRPTDDNFTFQYLASGNTNGNANVNTNTNSGGGIASININQPTNGQIFPWGTSISVTTQVTDPNGIITKVNFLTEAGFRCGGVPDGICGFGSDTTPPFTAILTTPADYGPSSTARIFAQAYDSGNNLVANSNSVTVTLVPANGNINTNTNSGGTTTATISGNRYKGDGTAWFTDFPTGGTTIHAFGGSFNANTSGFGGYTISNVPTNTNLLVTTTIAPLYKPSYSFNGAGYIDAAQQTGNPSEWGVGGQITGNATLHWKYTFLPGVSGSANPANVTLTGVSTISVSLQNFTNTGNWTLDTIPYHLAVWVNNICTPGDTFCGPTTPYYVNLTYNAIRNSPTAACTLNQNTYQCQINFGNSSTAGLSSQRVFTPKAISSNYSFNTPDTINVHATGAPLTVSWGSGNANGNNNTNNSTNNNTNSGTGTAKYKCSGTQCLRDDANGTFTDATCNNSCGGTQKGTINVTCTPANICAGSSAILYYYGFSFQAASGTLNATGQLTFPNIDTGSYVLVVNKSGYTDTVTPVVIDVTSGSTVAVSVTLTPTAGTPKYKCSGTQCIRDDLSGTFTDSACNNQCNGGGTGGQCGPAAKNYAANESFPAGALCSRGSPSPTNPVNPAPGASTFWECSGNPVATCSAARASTAAGATLAAPTLTPPSGSTVSAGSNISASATSPATSICWSAGNDPFQDPVCLDGCAPIANAQIPAYKYVKAIACKRSTNEYSPVTLGTYNISGSGTRGDVNADGRVDIVDVTILISYILNGNVIPNPVPPGVTAATMANGDVNVCPPRNTANINIVDVTTLITYITQNIWTPDCAGQ